jgi:hypothetical protein
MYGAVTDTAYNGTTPPYQLADLSTMYNDQYGSILLKLLDAASQLVLHPHIVLVAPSDQIASTESPGLQEVLSPAQTVWIATNAHFERNTRRESLEYFNRVIAGAIVTNDHLVGLTSLISNALELSFQKLTAIEGSHRHGD